MIELGLGTVQIGIPYGNASRQPLMPKAQAEKILETALAAGIRFFDTAIGYGESEARLGDFQLASKFPDVRISTKFPRADQAIWSNTDRYWKFLCAQLEASARRLRLESHELVQFHQCEVEFLNAPSVRAAMARLLAEKKCRALGISVYHEAEAHAAMEIPAVSWLQIPVNLLDRRFLKPDLLARCREKNCRLIGRSIFLQGILMPQATLPPVIKQAQLQKARLEAVRVAEAAGVSLHRAALAYVFGNLREVLTIGIIGVDSDDSLRENLGLLRALRPLAPEVASAFAGLSGECEESGLVDPSRWDRE